MTGMSELYRVSLHTIFIAAALVFVLLFFVSAPYGKFTRQGWGPSVRAKWAWMLMEFPSPFLMTLFFFLSDEKNLVRSVFLALWLSHYVYRTFVYSFIQSGRNKPYPVLLVVMAFTFNCFNGFVNGYGLFHLVSYNTSWLVSWQFIAGVMVFLSGFIINKTADEKLRKLRNDNPGVYVLPDGWLFRYVSSPHYLGEMIEWLGWALLTFSIPGLAFGIFTFANLFPRAWSSHLWYRKNFPDYPPGRKAVIPFII
ncbi:MAG: DUF1295 domain-containing protein [Bacteroidales bacterium]